MKREWWVSKDWTDYELTEVLNDYAVKGWRPHTINTYTVGLGENQKVLHAIIAYKDSPAEEGDPEPTAKQ